MIWRCFSQDIRDQISLFLKIFKPSLCFVSSSREFHTFGSMYFGFRLLKNNRSSWKSSNLSKREIIHDEQKD